MERKIDRKWYQYEFGGMPGNLALIILLPLIVYYMYFCVAFNDGLLIPHSGTKLSDFMEAIRPTWTATLIWLVWFIWQAVLYVIIPGKVVEGVPLDDGTRLKYKMNGLAAMIITFAVLALLVWRDWISWDLIYDNFGALISVITIFSSLFSVFLYFYGKSYNQERNVSGNFIRDFFMGTGHNPRVPPVRGFDFKFFCESRPGLIGWIVMIFSFMGVQHQQHDLVSTSMILVCVFQCFYIVMYFWNESFILTTMDIRHENFGFMLAFGDLAWLPMTYCIQAYYLIDHVHSLPIWAAVLISIFFFSGYLIFRGANLQKDRFRPNPDRLIWGKKPEYIETKQGSKLLTSGFWGLSRHANYLGDEMMAIGMSLPCLFRSPVPYFYPIYFAILLIHRERRDNRMCAKKYGEDWEVYCKKVRWRIIPSIY